jgi:hypothetical protein
VVSLVVMAQVLLVLQDLAFYISCCTHLSWRGILVVSLVVMAQVFLVLKHLVAVLALEDVVVLVSLLVPLPGKRKTSV